MILGSIQSENPYKYSLGSHLFFHTHPTLIFTSVCRDSLKGFKYFKSSSLSPTKTKNKQILESEKNQAMILK
jgi:hypothetical protein